MAKDHTHRWLIAPPEDAVDGRVPATCECGETRDYPAYPQPSASEWAMESPVDSYQLGRELRS